ncbi:MAG: 3'-5' exonuclease [bacterium]|nr:3'-5' exonuclease [bacterium]
MTHRFAVIDVETTGLNPAVDRVVEIACVAIDDDRIVDRWQSFIDPKVPIPARATAIHGITDDDVAGAPTLPDALRQLHPLVRGRTLAAHNAGFDLRFLAALRPTHAICTMRLARHLVPQAPNFKNQTLRAYLDVDRFVDGAIAHRALGDALVTAHVLLALRRRTLHAATWRDALEAARVA